MNDTAPAREDPEPLSAVRVLGSLFLALWLGGGAVVGFVVGTCHDTGGFCTGEIDGTNLSGYAIAVGLAALAATFAVLAFTRNKTALMAAAGVAAIAVALVAWSVEGGL